jgi:hypothetical protein
MRPLSGVERMLERLLERPSARLFRTRIQPIQIQRRIERAMERDRGSAGDRDRVPDRFTVHLAPSDLAGFGDAAEDIAAELADAALLFARERGYHLATRPRVELTADPSVGAGDVRLAVGRAAPHPSDDPAAVSDATLIFAVPTRPAPSAVLRALSHDGHERQIRIDGSLLTIGRAADNGLALDDSRVSRHHARLRARHGMLVLSDLDSTNGIRVNGVRVTEVALGVGDRIEIGSTVLVVDAVAAD